MSIYRRMLRSKIHRATVTDANLDYEGSLTLPNSLMQEADLLEYEAISVWNVTRGTRFETYAMRGEKEGDICVNGAAAHLAGRGDLIIIAAFADVPEDAVASFLPKIVFVDEENRKKEIRLERVATSTSDSGSVNHFNKTQHRESMIQKV